MSTRAVSSFPRASVGPHASSASKTGKRASESSRTQLGPRFTLALAIGRTLLSDVLLRLFAEAPGVQVVGHACDEEATSQMLRRETPQVLLFDFESARPNAESVISRLRHTSPGTRILVIADRACDEDVARALRAGASGLVDRQTSFQTLMRAIQSVAQGEVWANRRATAQALEYLANFDESPRNSGSPLSKREQEIADCVGRGLRNKEIAHLLNISQKTVKSHLNNIFRKLNLDGRIALALLTQSPTTS